MVREGILMVKERNLMMARHILLAVSLLTGDARLEFLKMRERIERAG